MKALVIYEKKAKKIELREVPKPVINKNDVLMNVKAAAICGTDIDFYRGRNLGYVDPPQVLGHEFSGTVAEVGSHVTDWKVGDRVVSDNTGYVCGTCEFCNSGRFMLCPQRKGLGYGMDGGFAEYVRIPGQTLIHYPGCLMRLPGEISFEEAAIMEPSANAYKAMLQDITLNPGQTVAIFGPGPIGLFCLQMAKIVGASNVVVIGAEGDEGRLKLALDLGADHIVDATQGKVVENVLEDNRGELFDVCVDAAGPPIVIDQALRLTKREGLIEKISVTTEPLETNILPLVGKALTIRGHFGYDYISWKRVFSLYREGKMNYKAMISRTLPLSRWEEGFEKMRKKEAIKIVFNEF